MFEFEEALRKAMECTAGLGFLLLQTKQLEEMTKGGDGVVNGGEIDLLRRSSFWKRQLRRPRNPWRAGNIVAVFSPCLIPTTVPRN